jgi:hypothetical protein
MFEVPDPATLAGMSEEELISALQAATREEAAAAARRLALVAETTARQTEDEDDVSAHQVIDGWALAQAQVSAACNLSAHAASKQMRIAMTLRDRLPRTAARFARGEISATVIDAISWRTHLVQDPEALACIDEGIAGEAHDYGARSEAKLIDAVDFWVEKFDPAARVRSKVAAKDIFIEFDDRDDPNGVCSFWGRLREPDKRIVEQQLLELAATVCPHDPRPLKELLATALVLRVANGPSLERIPCQCGDPACAGSGKDPRAAAVAIYVLAGQAPGAGQQTSDPDTGPTPTTGPNADAGPDGSSGGPGPAAPDPDGPDADEGETPEPPAEPGPTPANPAANAKPSEPATTPAGPAEPAAAVQPDQTPNPTPAEANPATPAAPTAPAASAQPAPAPSPSQNPLFTPASPAASAAPQFTPTSPGIMLGGGVIPADMLAELIAQGAKVRTLPDASALSCESRYRPSAALAAFVRMYQMTCAFPGCNKPAHRCDLDHLTPWPAGATHPGNLRPLCREHHLLKTFCGWNPVAHPDGRTTWTAPTGHTYTTIPGAAMLFPDRQIDTPIPRRRRISLLHDHRDAKMPTRKRTRAQDRAYRIKAARAQNTNDPPPF